jgi:hypothetical protein
METRIKALLILTVLLGADVAFFELIYKLLR